MSSAIFSRERPTVASVLGSSFNLYFSNFLPITLIGVVGWLPFVMLILGATLAVSNVLTAGLLMVVGGLGLIITIPAAYAATLHAVFQAALGKPVVVGESLTIGFARLGRTIGAAVLSWILMALGFLMLFIPGIILSLMLSLAIPVAALESVTVGQSLRRSAELMKGLRLMLFGVWLIEGLLNMVCSLFNTVLQSAPILSMGWSMVTTVILAELGIVVLGVMYFSARAYKESIGTDAIAAVFE